MQHINQVKQAITQGMTVHWSNPAYQVIKDWTDHYLIGYALGRTNENYVGLADDPYTIRKCYLSKESCKEIATKLGVEFVCYEPEEDAYFFQTGDYVNGFYAYRFVMSDMLDIRNMEFMLKNGLTNMNKV